ncbi:tetratricopeptide repeat protein [uncultured Lentibacter sp.]|uniref:tetratricopeptide repeat protein n=1 Tax=uncultured Lentibacter sp. TaxID=1659309 RepID=UPI002627FB91|nr:tetratricopeptide repeat protein [uncultured Lentibacter sp.]MCW1956494.1 tetratricopeptide repeat protein [Roseobacter sp.]
MSDTDSFIEEVTEEVRRDRLFAWMKRYGWIAVCAVLIVVGGAAFNEYRKAKLTAQTQAFGDAILSALENDEPAARVAALASAKASGAGAQSLLGLLTSKEQIEAGDLDGAKQTLKAVSDDSEAPIIYRQVASFKLLSLQAEDLDLTERQAGYEALIGGNPNLQILAEEQLALILIEQGNTEEAIAALSRIVQTEQASGGLRRRASQLIVALGGTVPDVTDTPGE